MKAVIMAGGKGTRLQSVTGDIPKPMVMILGKSILEYQIESLKRSGILDIIIIVGHLGHVIREHFGDGAALGVHIEYISEQVPLGTAGALYFLKDILQEDFWLVFGDLILDVDWIRFMEFHKEKSAAITLFGHPNAHPYDSDLILTDMNSGVIGIDSKSNIRNYYYHNFVNAGIYCVNPSVLENMETLEKRDFEKDIIQGLLASGKVYAYRSTEYVKDIGTPERLHAVAEDVQAGIVSQRSLRNSQKCIFLDRDGTINELNGFINNPAAFNLLPGAVEAVRTINRSTYLVIVATNQPVVARGECSFAALEQIHEKMETELGKEGAYLDDIYFCPHHPDRGYEGEVPELKIECECRKPKTGMLQTAAERYHIDLKKSWYIGDTTMDIQTGANASMRTILVKTGEAGNDGRYHAEPDYIADDLLQAVKLILERE